MKSAIIVKKRAILLETAQNLQKLVLVLAISMPVTGSDKKVIVRAPYIYYPVWFQKKQVRALLNSDSEVNAINPNYAWKLGLKIQKTNIGAQKIDSSALETFRIVIADFQVEDKANKPRFF